MLIDARKWIRETFVPGSRPPLKQVTAWVESGEIPGQIIGERVYVDDCFATWKPAQVQAAQKSRSRIDLLA